MLPELVELIKLDEVKNSEFDVEVEREIVESKDEVLVVVVLRLLADDSKKEVEVEVLVEAREWNVEESADTP